MPVECFLDANVLVYAVSSAAAEAGKKKIAVGLITSANFGVSAQALQEFYVTVTRKIKQPITAREAMEFIRSLAKFPLVPVDIQLIERASEFSQRYQISYWDGAIIAAAERLQAKVVYSEDLNNEQIYGAVQVLNPFQK
jgi:predicted nucleic acid-binding protein